MFGIGDQISNLLSAVMSFFISYLSGSKTFDKLKLPYRFLYLFGSGLSIIAYILILLENEDVFEYDDDNNDSSNKNNEYVQIELSDGNKS